MSISKSLAALSYPPPPRQRAALAAADAPTIALSPSFEPPVLCTAESKDCQLRGQFSAFAERASPTQGGACWWAPTPRVGGCGAAQLAGGAVRRKVLLILLIKVTTGTRQARAGSSCAEAKSAPVERGCCSCREGECRGRR